ncbi:hypothetical protein GJ744_008007 [Endocarpon pusillum]|uniref:Uncharacterized protein n=1 Tax=Endocarpon pusillum TaxID=364733 RepID=A0A8H7AJT1_9EURO|nr:hypothetical protein GJ744_008007 [Endocarpon pusillum]
MEPERPREPRNESPNASGRATRNRDTALRLGYEAGEKRPRRKWEQSSGSSLADLYEQQRREQGTSAPSTRQPRGPGPPSRTRESQQPQGQGLSPPIW